MTILAAAGLTLLLGWQEMVALLAGGSVALTNTLLLAWRARKDASQDAQDAQQQLRHLYRSALERFIVVVSLLAVGLGSMKFMPLPLLCGFVLGQIALVFSSILIRRIE